MSHFLLGTRDWVSLVANVKETKVVPMTQLSDNQPAEVVWQSVSMCARAGGCRLKRQRGVEHRVTKVISGICFVFFVCVCVLLIPEELYIVYFTFHICKVGIGFVNMWCVAPFMYQL